AARPGGLAGTLADTDITRVVEALRSDPREGRLHRDLLARALEWKATGNADKLLRGRELQEADDWLSRVTVKRVEPRPVALHTELLSASRKAQQNAARTRGILVTIILVVVSGLAILALLYAMSASEQRSEAQRRLAEQRAFGAFVD